MRFRAVRVVPKFLLKLGRSFLSAALPEQPRSKIHVSFGSRRIQAQRLVKLRDGVIDSSNLDESLAKIIVDVGDVGTVFRRSLEILDRFIQLTGSAEGAGEIVAGHPVFVRDRDRMAEQSNGVLPVSEIRPRDSAPDAADYGRGDVQRPGGFDRVRDQPEQHDGDSDHGQVRVPVRANSHCQTWIESGYG